MPKVTDEHIEARRSQIVMAACKCFSRKGFRQTTVRDICEEAKLSAGAVYGYFKSKDEITEALAEIGRRNTRSMLESTLVDGETALQSIDRVLTAAIGFIDSKEAGESLRLDVGLWGEAVHVPLIRKLLVDAMASTGGLFVELVRRGQRDGEIAPELDPESAARVLVAQVMGLVVQKTMAPEIDLGGCSTIVSALLAGSFATEGSDV